MLSLSLTRWLIGSVRFSIIGGSPELFFSLSARSGAYLWEITGAPEPGACVAARRYRYLRKNARRSGCRLRVRERRGLPFLLAGTKRHPGLWAGAAAFLAVLYLLSMQIWCIRITGCETVPPAQIEAALAAGGLSQGVWRKDVSPEKLSQQILIQFPQLRWMTINTRGCVAEVEVREKTETPQILDQEAACNLKAAATGQILSIYVHSGTPVVRRGDAVVEGQMLVSGVVANPEGGNTLLHASAQLMAETMRNVTVKVGLNRRRYEPTGRVVVRRNLDLMGAVIPLTLRTQPKGDQYEKSCEKADLALFGTALPAGIYTERWEEVRPVDYVLTREEALSIAKEEVRQQVLSRMKSGTILSETDAESWSDGMLVCTAALTCREDIAEESEIFIK